MEGNKDDADTVFKAFANSFEKSSSHWQARDEYLSDIKQDKNQTMAELDIYIKDLIRRCQFPPEDQESCKIDLLYHATAHFEVRKFIHNAKQEELKYDRMIEVAKAHERTCQEYQIHKQAHSMANPSNSYANPLIQTNALSKSFQKGPSKKTCGKCGHSHSHGDCPAYGTTCSKCGQPNHWAQQCRKSGRRNSSMGRSPSLGRPQNRQRCFSGNKPNKGRGRGRGGNVKQRSTPKRPGSGRGRGVGKPFKTNALTVTGLSGSQHPPKVDGPEGDETKESVSMNADLVRPAHPPKVSGEQFYNTFVCDALISNGNELYDPPSNKGKAYTDTDSDGKTEIITDITCKFKGKLIAMEVKVDPGSETNCIPLSHFRCLFPQLCSKDGSPKENALEPTLAQFEAYDGGIMTSHRWIILPTQDIRDNKFHPVRYYVVTREEARILISHATATWLGLVKVLCPNKAPRIKRQVASVSKKANEPSESNNSNSLSGPEHPPKEKYFYNNKITTPQHPPKVKYTGTVMVKEQQYELPTSKPHSHRRRCCKDRPAHREEEDQADNRPVKFQTSQTNNGRATSLGGRQSMLPHRISTPSQSEIKSVSNNRYCSSTSRTATSSKSQISGFLPKRQYYQPQDDEDTYYINSEGHLQCHQDPQNIIKAPTPQELSGSKEHPIFHKPGSIKISSVEDLLRLYPNSFDRLGSLKGEYDIKVDPTVPPVQHARRKVPIESKAAIEEAIDYMVKQDILEPQIEPTPWVSSVTYPVKPTGEVRPCLDARDLNKAIIRENHKPQTVEEIAHQLAGAMVFTKADALKAFLQVHLTEESSKLLVINTHKGRYRFKRMPFGAKMSQDVFQMKMDLIMERCPGVISIHDDIVVYGVSEEDHDANLVNLLNVAQIEGLVLNSKKLELKCPRVSFFGVEYSADGMHPCPKKIQGITEMTHPMDKQQLASFIGMVTYMGNFVPHLSHHTEPLCAMLKQEAVFAWDEMANASFQKIKDLIAKSATKPLHYYDRRKPVTVQADASQRGLGACLLQDGQPIAYASKSLTDAETRYANIQRELLAIVFACQWFNTYVLGRPFTVESDHKPLEMIHQKSLASAPPRLQ